MSTIALGIDVIQEKPDQIGQGERLGLLANQASLDHRLKTSQAVISELFPGRLTALFGPQHGYGGEDQDNMIETCHGRVPELNIPIFSLYSESREPSREMFDLIDTLIIDLQDVGTRVYTFPSTVLNCLKAASKTGREVVILDRPNPLGGHIIEGNMLKPELYSFVGPYRLPMRHGFTLGEMAKMFLDVFELDLELKIIPMWGWRRAMTWRETESRWGMPSPNMPLPETAQVYPGQVLWEGTNLSEGRGTCRPFEIFGAPFLNPKQILKRLAPDSRMGCHLQEIVFRPTFHKWAGQLCHGFKIHILDPDIYRPYYLSLSLLRTIIEIHPESFEWRHPPYEYEFHKQPIDLILGDASMRKAIEKGAEIGPLKKIWEEDIQRFLIWRRPYLLYS